MLPYLYSILKSQTPKHVTGLYKQNIQGSNRLTMKWDLEFESRVVQSLFGLFGILCLLQCMCLNIITCILLSVIKGLKDALLVKLLNHPQLAGHKRMIYQSTLSFREHTKLATKNSLAEQL